MYSKQYNVFGYNQVAMEIPYVETMVPMKILTCA
jgi:hypothetical protein